MDEIEIVDVIIKKKHRDSPRSSKLHERYDPLLNNSRQIFKCPQCSHIFSDENSLKIHVNFHLIETKYKPPFPCQESGMYDRVGNIPLQIHFEQEKDATTGKACETIMYTNQEYNKQEKTWSQCSQTYRSPNPVINHITNQSTMLFICSLCRQPFNDEVSFKNHIISHSRENNFPFIYQNLLPSRGNGMSGQLPHPVKRESPSSTGERAFYLEIPVKQENQQFHPCLEIFKNIGNSNQSVANHPQNSLNFPHCSQSFNNKQNLKTYINIQCSKDGYGEMFQPTIPLNDTAYLRDNSSWQRGNQKVTDVEAKTENLRNVLKQENIEISQCSKTCDQLSNRNQERANQVEETFNSLNRNQSIDTTERLKTHMTIQCSKNTYSVPFQNSHISPDVTYSWNNNSSLSERRDVNKDIDICTIKTSREESTVNLQNPVKQENDEPPQCIDIFNQTDNRNHTMASQSEQLFSCRHCSQSFKDEEELRKHVNIHFDKNTCNFPFISVDELFNNGNWKKDLLHSKEHPIVERAETSVSSNQRHNDLSVFAQTCESGGLHGSVPILSKEMDNRVHCSQSFKSGELSNRLGTNLHSKEHPIVEKAETSMSSNQGHHDLSVCAQTCEPGGLHGSMTILSKEMDKSTHCNQLFKSGELSNRLDTNLEVKKYTCPFKCQVSLNSKEEWKNHLMSHPDNHIAEKFIHSLQSNGGEYPYLCKYCDSTFQNFSYAKTHVLNVHFSLNCQVSLNSKDECKNHVTSHPDNDTTEKFIDSLLSAERPYICKYCDRTFQNFSYVKTHVIKVHFPHKTINNTCIRCKKKFKSASSLRKHIARMHVTNERPYVCTYCKKTYKSIYNVKAHMQQVHLKEKRFKCIRCEKAFGTRSQVKIHVRTHTGEQPYKCPKCSKAYNSLCLLKLHVMSHTGNHKPHTCPRCQKSFKTIKSLRMHVPTHIEERSYKCPQCQKAFKSASRVTVHIRYMHPSTKKSFKCSHCSKSFSKQANLKRHLRIHSEDRPYKCPVCDKTCNRVGNLKTHMRMHTGEKPYTCPQCKKSFTRMDNFKTHLRMHLRSGVPKSTKKKQ